MKLSKKDIDALIDWLASCSNDPLRFVLEGFDWGVGELEKFTGPDEWQRNILVKIRDGLLEPSEAIKIAVSSGHGIGKSALVAWIILWAITTMEDAKGVVTANTENQLRTKTWSELSKWHRLCIAKELFVSTATALFSADPDHQKTWRIDMIPWSEKNTEAFAGLHNQGKRILIVFDEASAIPDVIWEVTEGALTDEDTQILWVAFGNPTRNTGRFKECFGRFKHRWDTRQIDSRAVKITNKELIQQWIDDYGVDSDFVKVRVRGVFPSAGDKQFIPTDLIDAARGRNLHKSQFDFAPVVIGVDPAWDGGDETVIYLRQGLMSKRLAVYQKNDNDVQIAGFIARFEDEYRADAVFIDMGYGTGIVSVGRSWGRSWQLVAFGEKSSKPGFANKRTEMWSDIKEWLKEGGHVEDDEILCQELASPEADVTIKGEILLEKKQDMKKRGLSSPNRADALALTFAHKIIKKSIHNRSSEAVVHDPFDYASRNTGSFNVSRVRDPFNDY